MGIVPEVFFRKQRGLETVDTGGGALGGLAARGTDRHGEGRYVARSLRGGDDLVHALLFHLVDPHDRLQRNVGPLDAREFRLELLLRGVHEHAAALPEKNILHLDERVQIALAYLPGMELVDVPVVMEDHAVGALGFHGFRSLPARCNYTLIAFRDAMKEPGVRGGAFPFHSTNRRK